MKDSSFRSPFTIINNKDSGASWRFLKASESFQTYLENCTCNRLLKLLLTTALVSSLVLSPVHIQHTNGLVEYISAMAAQNRFAPGTNEPVVKDPEALLRNALPINNKPIRQAQHALEAVSKDVRTRSWSKIDQEVKQAKNILEKQRDSILAGVPESRQSEVSTILDGILIKMPTLREVIADKNSEEITRMCLDILRDIGAAEECMVTDFPYEIPAEYNSLPQLKGRAVVEMIIKKDNNAKFDLDGQLFDQGQLTLVIDGYSAPVTGGCFVDLVNRGFYNKSKAIRSDGFVIQCGDPDGPEDGYTDPKTKQKRTIPLEVFAKGDKAPTYGVTLEDDGRGAAATVLPFTAYGTLAMAREESDANSASSQFFWLLFDPELTPAGRNLLDGRYAVFGYTTSGQEYLKDFKVGDYIETARVTKGLENLKQ